MRDWIEGLHAFDVSLLFLSAEQCDYLDLGYEYIQDANTHFLGGK